jgi:hypothetical protein
LAVYDTGASILLFFFGDCSTVVESAEDATT